MAGEYWLDLFTGKTWEEFLKNGAEVTGFRERRRKLASRIRPGDFFICYLTGISRFVAILEVLSESYYDETPRWQDEVFPVRLKVKLLYKLDPKSAIPVHLFKDKLSIFKRGKSARAWAGPLRGSPVKFPVEDGEVIVNAIKDVLKNPVQRDFDTRKYWRRPKTYASKIGEVTVPPSEPIVEESEPISKESPTHEEIQYELLKLGSDMGLDVWVARNDINKEFNGHAFKEIPNLRKQLPRQFDEATNRTVELIDVLWLQRDAIVAAFEVEHTTAIYSGLLRMSDLVTMQPNINLNLYLVASDEKREKVFSEIRRPTFARLKPPLPKICRFIPYSKLRREIDYLGARVRSMRPEFLQEISESCED